MNTRYLSVCLLAATVSTGAFAQTDHPDNNLFQVTGDPVLTGGPGTVLNSFAPPNPPVGPGDLAVGLEHDGNGDLLNTEIVSDDFFTHNATDGTLVSGPFNIAANTAGTIGIATDGTNIYVSDTVGLQVDIYTTAGAFVSSFDVSAFTTFPEGLTVAPFDGNLYVVNGSGGNSVGVFDTAGNPGPTFPINGSSQDGIAFDTNRCLFWIYDSGTDTVRAYDSSFTEATSFPGTGANGFGTGEGLAVIDDSLFVMATGSNTVVEFDIADVERSGDFNELCAGTGPARFEVNKDFNDDNTAEVEVSLSCNTGLPLEQTTTIAEGDNVTFVVNDFEDGAMDCEVTEVVPGGYTASYDNGAATTETSCEFTEINMGTYWVCDITNTLDQVEVEVTKVWIDENPQFNNPNVAGASWSCSNVASGSNSGFLNFNGNPDTDGFFVYPDWDTGTTCSITEVDLFESGIEVDDSECQGLVVFPDTGASCTIYNTRLYEGIPTLSQYGLGILALLMLGMGFVAFRRFA